jgi:RNA polymerase sigma-70 factor (ECF subfamily)
MAEATPNHELFLQLFMRHERAMRIFARTLLWTWDDVDEVMQQTSMIAWRKFADYTEGTNFVAWLSTILRYEALKLRRSKHRDRLVFSDELLQVIEDEGSNELEEINKYRSALNRCLEKLSEPQVKLLQMTYSSGMKLKEVSETTGYSVQAFYKTIQRLRAALLKCAENELRQGDFGKGISYG